jgi:hypothetical protein
MELRMPRLRRRAVRIAVGDKAAVMRYCHW